MRCSQPSAHPINCPALTTGLGTESSWCFTGQEGSVDPDLGCLSQLLGREGSLGNLQAVGVVLHVLVDTRMFPPADPNNLEWGFQMFQD